MQTVHGKRVALQRRTQCPQGSHSETRDPHPARWRKIKRSMDTFARRERARGGPPARSVRERTGFRLGRQRLDRFLRGPEHRGPQPSGQGPGRCVDEHVANRMDVRRVKKQTRGREQALACRAHRVAASSAACRTATSGAVRRVNSASASTPRPLAAKRLAIGSLGPSEAIGVPKQDRVGPRSGLVSSPSSTLLFRPSARQIERGLCAEGVRPCRSTHADLADSAGRLRRARRGSRAARLHCLRIFDLGAPGPLRPSPPAVCPRRTHSAPPAPESLAALRGLLAHPRVPHARSPRRCSAASGMPRLRAPNPGPSADRRGHSRRLALPWRSPCSTRCVAGRTRCATG